MCACSWHGDHGRKKPWNKCVFCLPLTTVHLHLLSQVSSEKAVASRLQAENAAGRAELEKLREELAAAKEQLQGAQQATVSAVLGFPRCQHSCQV